MKMRVRSKPDSTGHTWDLLADHTWDLLRGQSRKWFDPLASWSLHFSLEAGPLLQSSGVPELLSFSSPTSLRGKAVLVGSAKLVGTPPCPQPALGVPEVRPACRGLGVPRMGVAAP